MKEYPEKVRHGKTKKDRESGAPQRRADNRRVREEWMHQTPSFPVAFPKAACNGKKNRHRWTGAGNELIIKI